MVEQPIWYDLLVIAWTFDRGFRLGSSRWDSLTKGSRSNFDSIIPRGPGNQILPGQTANEGGRSFEGTVSGYRRQQKGRWHGDAPSEEGTSAVEGIVSWIHICFFSRPILAPPAVVRPQPAVSSWGGMAVPKEGNGPLPGY